MKKYLIILLMLLMGLGISVTYAEEDAEESDDEAAEDPTVVTVNATDTACAKALATSAETEFESYVQFLTEYFKIDTESSGQIETAMERYRYYKDAIEDAFVEASPIQGGESQSGELDSFTYCKQIRDQYIEIANEMLMAFALQSANSKKAYLMVDGLKAINEKMNNFSMEFSGVFPGMFDQINNGLGCYAKQCLYK